MKEKILKAIREFSLLEKGSEITVALSGGADSMALLNSLLSLKEELGITVNAAHLNHMIRGEEALRDENFVKRACCDLGVELFCERVDVPKIAEREGKSLELAAREVRYEFLQRVSGGLIATAHNADDNLETVILNLSRGTAIDGLCGIPPKRERLIRPLILVTRKEIEEYCHKNGIAYVTDSTNLSDCYTRNKIRHNIVPVLRELNPSIEETVLRTGRQLREISKDLNFLADAFIEKGMKADGALSLEGFSKLSKSVAKRVLKKFIDNKDSTISPESIHIEEAFKKAVSGGKISLPKGYSLVFSKKTARLEKVGFKALFEVKIKETDAEKEKIHNLLLNNAIDCDKIVGKSVLRTRLPGDSIRLLNRGCTKSLNKLFNEEAVPASVRDSLPVIADDNGVIWVYGSGVAQRCAVTEKTKKIKIIEVKCIGGKY